MSTAAPIAPPLSRAQRRRSVRLAYAQAALWSIGNGMTTGTVITYPLQDMGANGEYLGWFFAIPALVGLLRLFVPRWLQRHPDLLRFAVAVLIPSYLLIFALPTLTMLNGPYDASSLAHLRLVWLVTIGVHQCAEYLGSVALFAWLGEIVPSRVRGRFFDARQRWMLLLQIPLLLASGLWMDWVKGLVRAKSALSHTGPTSWLADGPLVVLGLVPLLVGAVCLLLSVFPMWLAPRVQLSPRKATSGKARSWSVRFPVVSAIRSRPLRRLLIYATWFSFFNGLTQAAQAIYPYVLKVGALPLLMMVCGMRAGQLLISPACGRWADQFGNRTLLVVSQLIVALGPLFFFWATPQQPWWMIGGWIAFIAYAGINIALPNITLKLAPPGESPAYLALRQSFQDVAFAGASILGGILLDAGKSLPVIRPEQAAHTGFLYLFHVGFATRLCGALLALALIEPGAWGFSDLLRRKKLVDKLAPIPHPLD